MPNLIIERGREKGASFELRSDAPCVAGRDPQAVQIVITDAAASRRHFQVAQKDGRWYVEDLGSRNHTYVNAELIEKPVELANGDRIQVGETVMSFIDEDKGDKATAQGLNGKEIGGYRILERIGRGGMGTVFKAKQISLNRVVALKVLASKFAKDPKFVEKFQSEARAAGQLNHPNVVQVFDVGQSGGLHYFSMEFMEGGCVQDLLSAAPDSRLSWQEAMPLIVDAARGLVFAEKRGIIHRDIKPDNLMLTSEQRVKIGDLGLAKRAEEGSGDKAIFGTPHFIAPEQARGLEVTHAADLYSMGATFYRMVTGRTPFGGETVKEILRQQINEPHTPVTQIVPDFPEDLARIVDRLMAKKVENRYQSATKLVEDLESFELAHQIELSGARKLNKPLMIGLIGIALAAGAVGIYYATRPPEVVEKTNTVEKIVEVGEKGEKLTEEQKNQLIASRAKDAYYALRELDPRRIELSNKKALRELAEKYEDLSTTYSDPAAAEAIKPGLDRAAEIRRELQRLEEDEIRQAKARQEWIAAKLTAVHGAEKGKRWVEAIRLAEEALKDNKGDSALKSDPASKDDLARTPERVVTAARTDYLETKRKAEEAIEANEITKGIAMIQAWIDALDGTRPENVDLKDLVTQGNEWIANKRAALGEKLEADLDADKAEFIDAVRGLRTGASGNGFVFDFQFGEAASQFDRTVKDLRTQPFKDRRQKLLDHLGTAQRGWNGWLQRLAEGKLFAAGEELKGLPGAAKDVRYKLDLSAEDHPGPEGFTVKTVLAGGIGSSSKKCQWADFSREELAQSFILPKVDQVPGDVAYGLAWMFTLLGDDEDAQRLLDRAFADGVKVAPEEETSLRRELAAVKEYDALRVFAGTNGSDPNEIVKKVEDWRRQFGGSAQTPSTDMFILLDGRPAKSLLVLSQEQIDAYLTKPK